MNTGKIPFVDLSPQHRPIQEELQRTIQRVIGRGDFVLGEEVDRFEGEFAAFCGARFGVGVGSGLAALELSLRALGIGPGDEVIVPTLSFVATAAAVTFTGAEPVFVDVDPSTYCIDVRQVEAAVTTRTRAVIPVHFYGLAAEMDGISRIAERHGLAVIEDAAQAHGARYKGRRTGSLGQAAAFSFYPSKNLGAFGDGGMVVTNDSQIADRVRAMRNCGQIQRNRHELPPYCHRLDTLQAAVLRVKLGCLDRWNEDRQQIAARYATLLRSCEVGLPARAPDRQHVYHLFVVRSSHRDALRARLQRHGIETGIHYPTPIHLQPFYGDKGLKPGQFPQAERLCQEILSLPMYPGMPTVHTQFVAFNVWAFSARPRQIRAGRQTVPFPVSGSLGAGIEVEKWN